MVHVSVGLLTAISVLIIPIITDLLTKYGVDAKVKSVVTIILALVSASVQWAINANGVIDWQQWLVQVGMVWAGSVVAYLGAHKPLGVSNVVQNLAPGFGVGTVTPATGIDAVGAE